LELDVKDAAEVTRPIPLHDYGPALQNAVSWLGNRYLLAEPAPRRSEDHKPHFSSPRGWLDSSRSQRVYSARQ
jgi:hypothetical protein